MLENACVREERRLSAHQENKEKERRKRIDIELHARGCVSNNDDGVFTVCKSSWTYAALKITRYSTVPLDSQLGLQQEYVSTMTFGTVASPVVDSPFFLLEFFEK